jgi:hypothetical protein
MNTLTKYGYPRLKNGFDPNMAQWRGSIIEVINIRFLKSEVCLDQWQTNSFKDSAPFNWLCFGISLLSLR